MNQSRWLLFLFGLLQFFSCNNLNEKQLQQVELLNHRAFNFRYTSLDSIEKYAIQALNLSEGYSQGLSESYNNLALAAYMKQDFWEAEKYYGLARKSTHNQIELLMSDIGMLKVCSRQSSNKRFYDYVTQIHNRLVQIHKEIDTLKEHDLIRLIYGESDFHLTMAIYFYYMQNDSKAKEELARIDSDALAEADSIQWAYYEYMMASVDMLGGNSYEEDVKLEFDSLLRLLFYAREKGLIYIEANVLETFVDKLNNSKWNEIASKNRSADFVYLNPNEVPDSLITEKLSVEALECFKRYGDYYQISSARRRLSDVYFIHGKYEAALAEQLAALNDINKHYDKYNQHVSYKQHLEGYNPNDTIEVDLQWMLNDSISAIPQWLANLRQSLSLSYAALGNKAASDYNRNIYLDLLDKTRQDKEQESRLEQLKNESRTLTVLLWVIAIFTLFGGILLYLLSIKWRRRNSERIKKLSDTSLLCNDITSSIPTNVEDQEELLEAICQDLRPKLKTLFGCEILIKQDEETKTLSLQSSFLLNKDDRNLLSLIEPYLNWAYQYGSTYLNLDDEFKRLEKERYLHELHIADNKRKNLEKRTCMSIVTGITPFLDRAINEISRLKSGTQTELQKNERYVYIQELIDRINEYNEILALWIKMKQGALSLQIESFNLADIFNTIAKGRRSYEIKGLEFEVTSSNSIVKADKALTLFMINTLCDNARKYTPSGGFISVKAEESEDYVEISVQDSGRGISDVDRKTILEEKVYDSSRIGITDKEDTDFQKSKGYGFGLMNCKGIIDKYKKTNPLFSVCTFDIESELGKGSRFFFRLPKGILRLLIGLIFIITGIQTYALNKTDYFLLKATAFADSTYYSNIDGYYEDAFVYADSACFYLNKYYLSQYPSSNLLMSMAAGGNLAELKWWEQGVNTDYHIILDIRNEKAIAALALGEWDIYRTNNEGYTRLYKILGEDKTLDMFCEQMRNTANTKTVSVFLFLIIALIFLVIFYSLYFRQSLLYRINVQQVLEANKKVMQTFMVSSEDRDEEIATLPDKMLARIFQDINAIQSLEGLAIKIRDNSGNLMKTGVSHKKIYTRELEERLITSLEQNKELRMANNHCNIFPLRITQNDETTCIGSIAFIQNDTPSDKKEKIIRDLIINYISIVIYQTVIRLSHKQVELVEAEDEKRRAIHEENLLHVQNMVLDNCLSTLKHETMYYPNRIKQIVDKLLSEKDVNIEEKQIQVMGELMTYYKDIFTTLSDCANRQLENLKFSRKNVPVKNLQQHLEKYLKKVARKNQLDWTLQTEYVDFTVIGDEHLLDFLMENLIDCAVEKNESSFGDFKFSCEIVENFVKFSFEDPRGHYKQSDLNLLFYPDINRMQSDNSGQLHGTQYLNMRQIIRDHDELCRHRGCRINVEERDNCGYKIWFTLPLSKKETN